MRSGAQFDDAQDDDSEVSPATRRLRMREQARTRASTPAPRHRASLVVAAGLALLAVIIVVGIAIALTPASDAPPAARRGIDLPGWFGAKPPNDQPLPVVQPVALMDVPPETARQLNAAVPYAPGPIPAARSFAFSESAEDRAAARICLAGAVLYEAGTSPIDQYAVAQVVLNRVRHPAFAKTVCGVVFQGAARRTGCQFTFACDGALQRRPSVAAWNGALATADAALTGFVFTPIGTATHYHTDWVFPYWQASLTKLVAVHTHIFYRWPGWWGSSAAFSARVGGTEQVDPRLLAAVAGLETGQQIGAVTPSSETPSVPTAPMAPLSPTPVPVRVPGLPAGLLKGNVVRFVAPDAATVILHIDRTAYSGSFAVLANVICAEKADCLVLGFADDSAVPGAIAKPSDALRRADFLFRRKEGIETPEMVWNCTLFPRSTAGQCRTG